jgi:hypothetical protein
MNIRWKAQIMSPFRIAALIALNVGLGTVAHAACYAPESRLSQDKVQSFLSNPTEVLASNPTGGDELIGSIRTLVASDEATLPVVIKLLSTANPHQQAAIGSGLALASRICLGTGVEADQSFAGQIQSQLAASGIGVALTAFVSDGGQETATAATGAGAPAPTAYVSGFLQVTGGSRNINSGTSIGSGTVSGGTTLNPVTITGSTAVRSRSPSRSVSQ